ncbi:WYL domain-containing protein [Flavihumibacter sp. RY-1]|uniref:WYL domain-containing protein n=2 Tax=Flavihumibacter fluminis TaxID=2909236 RepID=A0ABS9BMI7_9BACT|nr:WYL domain-containing protein [Flavihumibacter fluminis]
MSPRDYILPYYTLVHHLQQTVGANREELMNALQQAGCELSLRTFQRLLESLRSDLGIRISYDASTNQYHLEEMPEGQLGNFFRYCKYMQEAGFILDLLKTRAGEDKSVYITPVQGTAGAEWLSQLTEAINEKKILRLTLSQNKGEDNKTYSILPVAIKQEDETWVLLAWQPKKEKWRQIKAERIVELQTKAPGTDIDPPQQKEAVRQFKVTDKQSRK